MLFGSAQTLSTLGSMSSIESSGRSSACASNCPDADTPAIAVQSMHKLNRADHSPVADLAIGFLSGVPEAAVFCFRGRLGFLFMLLRSSARNDVVGASPEI